MANLQDFVAAAQSFQAGIRHVQKLFKNAATNVLRLYSQYAQKRYDETGNPLFAWNVYRQQRLAGEPIPDWVLAYFDRVSANLDKMQQEAGSGKHIKNPAAEISVALEMKKPGRSGRRNMFSDDAFPFFDFLIGSQVWAEIEKGSQETYAVDSVAGSNDLARSKVYRSWQWYKKFAVSESPRISEP